MRLERDMQKYRRLLDQSSDAGTLATAMEFMQARFHGGAWPTPTDGAALRKVLLSRLQRPLRVCGMVKNEGEPGGGPFWVRHADGSKSVQIVETAEVERDDDRQAGMIRESTHFNPVFMALAVRNEKKQLFDLTRFIDEDRVIITHKPIDGGSAVVLERPGLWNGGMARYNTVFVEVPMEVFAPVKTVLDLLRPQHQPLPPRYAPRDRD